MSKWKPYASEWYPHYRERDCRDNQPVYKKVQPGNKISTYGAFGIPWLKHDEIVTRRVDGTWYSAGVTKDDDGKVKILEHPLHDVVRGRYAEIDDGPAYGEHCIDNTPRMSAERVANALKYCGRVFEYHLFGPNKADGAPNGSCQSACDGFVRNGHPNSGTNTQGCCIS